MTATTGRLIGVLAAALLATAARGETMYVSDRILLGLHAEPSEQSALLTMMPSGTPVQVVQRREDFIRVKLDDGTEGWASTGFLVAQQPAQRLLEDLNSRHQKLEQELAAARSQLAAREAALKDKTRELESLSAAAEQAGGEAPPAPADAELKRQLGQAHEELETLRARLLELQAAPPAAPAEPPPTDPAELAELEQENLALRSRIEMAQALLHGEQVPPPEELASIRPRLPAWYLGLVISVGIAGFVGGTLWFDYQSRKRHGGFRV